MVIKSVPIDDMNVVVFAIRGSQTFMDWAVNLRSAPVPPEGFLVSPLQYCLVLWVASYSLFSSICVLRTRY